MSTQHTQHGFILPTILAISFAIIAVMVGLLLVTSTTYKSGYVDHYQKLADEAAEAGAAYATACLTLSSHIQTWGPGANGGARPNLTPNTSCNGTNSYSGHIYVYNDSTVRTFFTVGNLDYSLQFSAQISALGTAQVLKTDGTVEKTYTSVQKKVITWPTEVVGQMSASGSHRTCALVTYNVYCWGFNAYGQLGDGRYLGPPADIEDNNPSVDSLVPVKVHKAAGVMAGKQIVKIFAAQHHSCALSDDGLMYCWGFNNVGQLGTGNTTDSPVPVQVGGALAGKVITDIGGTNSASCAIAESKIYCWGTNANGVSGMNTSSGTTLTPTLVYAANTSTTLPTSYTATALSTSGSRSKTMCAIVNGKAYCWGQNAAGSVGDGTTTQRLRPTKVLDSGVLSGKTVTAISQDGYVTDANDSNGLAHVCAIADSAVYCWGENNSGQLGNNSTVDVSSPVAVITSGVLSGKTIQDLQAGLRHTCVRANSGAYCWGNNGSGQVGDGTNATKWVPTTVSQQPGGLTSSNVVSIGGGSNRGCAVVSDGRTFCWGVNTEGQIGDGTTISRNVPTESLFLRPNGNQYIF